MLIGDLIHGTFGVNLQCKDGKWFSSNPHNNDVISKYLTQHDGSREGGVDINNLGIYLRNLINAREQIKEALKDTDEHHHDYLVKVIELHFKLLNDPTRNNKYSTFNEALNKILVTINNPLTKWDIGLDRKSKVLIFKDREHLNSLDDIIKAKQRGSLIELNMGHTIDKKVYLFHVGEEFQSFLTLLARTLKFDKT